MVGCFFVILWSQNHEKHPSTPPGPDFDQIFVKMLNSGVVPLLPISVCFYFLLFLIMFVFENIY